MNVQPVRARTTGCLPEQRGQSEDLLEAVFNKARQVRIEKIHDLHRRLASDGRYDVPDDANLTPEDTPMVERPRIKVIGVINHKFVRLLAFLVISLSVIGCAAICVMAVWEYVDQSFAWRAVASLGIISAATGIFVALNEGFGPAVRE